MQKPKTILVTGCAGFIGGNFCRQFRKKFPNTEIIGIDNLSTGRRSAIEPTITFYKGSILNATLLEKIFAEHKPEFVFHFAAIPGVGYSVEHPRKTAEVNIVGTAALLEAAQKHGAKRFIYSASSSVYGGVAKMPTKESENLPSPQSPYAAQKYASEILCCIASQISNLDTVCLRYFNVFGPGQYAGTAYAAVIPAWLETIFPAKISAKTERGNKKFLRGYIEGDGNQTRDFCFIENVVSANIIAMKYKKRLKGDVFNIACGERTSLNQTAKMIEKFTAHTGKKLNLEKRPARIGDIRHSYADISKAQKTLDYKPKVKFEEGLKRTVAWFESRKN